MKAQLEAELRLRIAEQLKSHAGRLTQELRNLIEADQDSQRLRAQWKALREKDRIPVVASRSTPQNELEDKRLEALQIIEYFTKFSSEIIGVEPDQAFQFRSDFAVVSQAADARI